MSDSPLVNKIIEEINGSKSDRGTAVLGGSFAEAMLRNLILTVTVPQNEFEKIVERTPPANLLLVAYSFGLIPDELRQDVSLIFKIRNKFAHTWENLQFDSPTISRLVSGLIAPKRFGPIKGGPIEAARGTHAKTLGGLETRIQFVSAVIGASTSLEHIADELRPIQPSRRFYIDPRVQPQ